MSKQRKLLVLVAMITGVVVVGLLLSRRSGAGAAVEEQATATDTALAEGADMAPASSSTRHGRGRLVPAAAAYRATGGPGLAANLITNWEEKVDDVLGTSSPDLDKAKQLMEIFPQLPADGQEEVARHLSNLLPDSDYGLMQTFLTNSALPEEVLDVLLDDVLNRPNSLKLPALLAVAQSPQHPRADEAKDFLELFLDEDYGNDWEQWQVKMGQWLAANPD